MRINTKLPQGLTGISKLMGMQNEEVRACPYYKELVNLFKDYNYGVLHKESLIQRLKDISNKCNKEGIEYFAEGVNNASTAIAVLY